MRCPLRPSVLAVTAGAVGMAAVAVFGLKCGFELCEGPGVGAAPNALSAVYVFLSLAAFWIGQAAAGFALFAALLRPAGDRRGKLDDVAWAVVAEFVPFFLVVFFELLSR